jgi:hypothetical protein
VYPLWNQFLIHICISVALHHKKGRKGQVAYVHWLCLCGVRCATSGSRACFKIELSSDDPCCLIPGEGVSHNRSRGEWFCDLPSLPRKDRQACSPREGELNSFCMLRLRDVFTDTSTPVRFKVPYATDTGNVSCPARTFLFVQCVTILL